MKLAELSAVLMSGIGLAGCGTTIKPGEVGVKYLALHEPALQKEAFPEGFYFQWWWNSIVAYDVTWQSRQEEVEILTADDLHVPATSTVTYRAKPEKISELHTQIGTGYYEELIRPLFRTLLRDEFARHEHNDLARESAVIEQEVLTKLRQKLEGRPVEIDRVAITHVRFDPEVTKSISEKLVKKQLIEQKQFELDTATKESEIILVRAKALSDSLKIQAEGDGQALLIKGRAQAEAQESITRTLTREYLLYKAFEGNSNRYFFLPTDRDGLPVIINAAEGSTASR